MVWNYNRLTNLRIGVFYDDGGEKFGGDIAYVYNISEPQLSPKAGINRFCPRFVFADSAGIFTADYDGDNWDPQLRFDR